jgi:NADH dehydrogenase
MKNMKVVIIGGGFGGLQLAKRLNNVADIEVLLIDQYNYHQFQPLFYQVATAGLDASNISFPLRKVFQHSKNVQIRLTKVEEIIPGEKKIRTTIGYFDYDKLVIATGADTNFFNNKNLEQKAFPMKSTTEALQVRHTLIQNLEEALEIKDKDDLETKLSIVVVGGGPTGVEVSGALAELRNNVLPKDYPELDFSLMKIYLVEGSPRTLAAMSVKSSAQSQKYLEHRLGVTVITETHVKDYDGTNIVLDNGTTIKAKTVIWAAGIKGNVPEGIKPELIVRGNRIKVDRTNKVLGFDDIYVIGDVAYMETPKYPKGHPQVANVAINQAKNLAVNLKRQVTGNKHYQDDFEYHDKGSLATVGRNLAVVDIPKPKLHFGGFFAWIIWMVLHLVLILGVKNRLQIFINWAYKYFTHDQSLRLLFKNFYKQKDIE